MNYAIIAAGSGSRLAQEGIAVPKPLADLGGRTMIQRLTDIMASCRPESVSIIVNDAMPDVRACVDNIARTAPFAVNIITASTGGSMESFARLAPVIPQGRFILTTVDAVFRADDFRRYVEAFDSSDDDGLFAVTRHIDDEKPLYVVTDPATGIITAFSDTPVPGSPFVSGGIYGLTPKALEVLADCTRRGISRMRDYQRALLDAGLRLRAFEFPVIIDADHAADLEKARNFISSDTYNDRRRTHHQRR